MDSHQWVLPWLSLIAGGATLAVAFFHYLKSEKSDISQPSRIRISGLVTWLALVIVGVLVEMKVGVEQSVDYIGARGFVLGSIGGAALVLLTSRPLKLPSLAVFGVTLTQLAIARLWLTHGEMTGLTAVAIGMTIAVLCLGVDRGVDGMSTAISGVVLTATLAIAMQMGFSRADEIAREYWPDIPLLITGGCAIGLLIASAVKGRSAEVARGRRWVAVVLPPFMATLVAWWGARYVMHEMTALKLLAIGTIAAILMRLLQRIEPSTRNGALGLVLLFAATAVAYSYWAGYGIALLMLAGWTVYAAVDVGGGAVDDSSLLGPLAAGAIVAIHRAVTLQNGDALSNGTDISDTWNLLAAAIGASLPLAASALTSMSTAGMATRIATTVSTVLALVVPPLLCAYLFAGQASAAFVIGAAFTIAALAAARRPLALASMGAVTVALVVLQAMPLIAEWKAPSRHLKIEILIAITVVMVILSLLPRRTEPVAKEA